MDPTAPTAQDFSIFVGDLCPSVTDQVLLEFFAKDYPSARTAKVIMDPTTGRSRGYGFVRFLSEAERDRSLTEKQNWFLGTRQIRVSLATARRNITNSSGGAPSMASTATTSAHAAAPATSTEAARGSREPAQGEADPHNTTLFIGGLSSVVNEEELRAIFMPFGHIVYVKIPQGKGCGFVQFMDRRSAERAMEEMSGAIIGNAPIRISWGRSTNRPTPAHGAPPPPGGVHYMHGVYGAYPGYYDPYGAYGMMSYDPYGYAAAYPGAVDVWGAYPGYAMLPGMPGYNPAAAAAAAAASAAGHPGTPAIYDPSMPPNVDKMNAAFMHRHVPVLTAAYLRMPTSLAS